MLTARRETDHRRPGKGADDICTTVQSAQLLARIAARRRARALPAPPRGARDAVRGLGARYHDANQLPKASWWR